MMISDVFCSGCGTHCDYGDIVWMGDDGAVYCLACRTALLVVIPSAREYVVIEWPHDEGTSVLQRHCEGDETG